MTTRQRRRVGTSQICGMQVTDLQMPLPDRYVTDLQRGASRIVDAEVAGGGVRDLLEPWWIWAPG
jgi:hypothetical protein